MSVASPRPAPRVRRRLAAAVLAAGTCLALLSTTSIAAADPAAPTDRGAAGSGLTGPDVSLPTADLKHHPLAVPGSTPERRAAMARLGPEERTRLAAAITKAPRPPGAPTLRREPDDPWQAWPDIVAGRANPAAAESVAAPRFAKRAPATARGDVRLAWDGDADGLDDGFEDLVADAFTPVYHVSNGEYPWTGFAGFADAPNQVTVSVRSNPPVPPISNFRVQPLGFGTDGNGQQVSVLRLDYLTLWNWDDGLVIGGACIADLYFLAGWVGFSAGLILDGLQAHEFDNERSAVLVAAPVAEPWVFNQDPWAYSAYSFYTAGHEGTFTDTSAYYFANPPVPAGSHINLALSLSKHATYAFNPSYLPLLPGWFQASVYSTIDFLWFTGVIEEEWLYLALLGIADGLFFFCFVEHFFEMGGWFADPRINVGEPGHPINGSSFIADPDLAPKLTVPLW